MKKMDKFYRKFNSFGSDRYSVYSISFYYKAPLMEMLTFKIFAKSFAELIPQEFHEFLPGIAILAYDNEHGGPGKAHIHFNNDRDVPYLNHCSNPDLRFSFGVSVLANVVVSICISITCAHVCSIT